MQKEKVALDRIKGCITTRASHIGHSGGKDSTVILHLTNRVSKELSLDPCMVLHNYKDSISANDMEIVHGVAKTNPLFIVRSVFMANINSCQIDGTRKSEFNRTDKANNLIIDGKSVNREHMPVFVEKGLYDMAFLYPIYDWTDEEVFAYITKHKLKISKDYV